MPAIGILFLMFVVPAEPRKTYKSSTLLTWKVFQEKMPWGLLILLGGGYALADGAKVNILQIVAYHILLSFSHFLPLLCSLPLLFKYAF